ncbi:MAG: entericidin [Paludibacteraceae bacterium]|nr:entericidin [Paludibacteraceae bacterium]
MKKVVLFFAISAAFGFASCEDKAANANNQDSTAVAADTVAAQDSAVSDSVVVADTLASEIDSVKALGEAQAE